MVQSRVREEKDLNPNNIIVGDFVTKNSTDTIGYVESKVPNKGKLVQFWVTWLEDSKKKNMVPETASLLTPIEGVKDYLGKEIDDGKVTHIRVVNKKVKYEITTDLGTPRLKTLKEIEKAIAKYQKSNSKENESESIVKGHEAIENKGNSTPDKKGIIPEIMETVVNVYDDLVVDRFSFTKRLLIISDLVLDQNLQQRSKLNNAVINEYAEAYKAGESLPPIEVYHVEHEYYVVDGFHRVKAAKNAGFESIQCRVYQGSYRQAYIRSLSVNSKHGFKRSNHDKKMSTIKALQDEEVRTFSLRQIGSIAGVSQTYVKKIKDQLFKEEQSKKELTALESITVDNPDQLPISYSEENIDTDQEFSEDEIANEVTIEKGKSEDPIESTDDISNQLEVDKGEIILEYVHKGDLIEEDGEDRQVLPEDIKLSDPIKRKYSIEITESTYLVIQKYLNENNFARAETGLLKLLLVE